ncbi:TM2 domain-containing protein [Nitrospirillum iridis]|uniref:TM2 domain-containing membrane protein YozV n=1 Tax=Nitrospirillum iridis TaxID=765888 RepID=A0A7X0B5D8_9PROT|nr:TM2 domain-containing protein [Nitrospirillum iridis]MBB6254514.1 TM2 domain-containing membrane protein YozV [Nitrospirillum iridis]
MLGTILSYSAQTGDGIISGADGQRYAFRSADWRSEVEPLSGRKVDFIGTDGIAQQVYAVAAAPMEKNKLVACLLAFFLGTFGIHKFYLGYNAAGLIMLLVFLFGFIALGIPSVVIGLIALIEGILYIVKSDEEFEAVYVRGKRAWF